MTITYQIFNQNNPNWIIGYYGFGQEGTIFMPLIVNLKNKYNFLIIELNYIEDKKYWTKVDFHIQMNQLLANLGIKKFVGLSYSVGSRFNLCLAETMSEKFESMILIAPDGLKMGFWNQFATNNMICQNIFKALVLHPSLFHRLINIFSKLNFIPTTLFTFAKWHMRDITNRKKVYAIWMNMRKIIPDLNLFQIEHKKHLFPIVAYFGTSDDVINKKCQQILKNKIPQAEIILLNKGHKLLNEELFNDIATYLN